MGYLQLGLSILESLDQPPMKIKQCPADDQDNNDTDQAGGCFVTLIIEQLRELLLSIGLKLLRGRRY